MGLPIPSNNFMGGFLKKSYDYFKTLKNLSDEIYIIYENILKNKDYSSHRIFFFAEKSDLVNNLQNEFITPLERGDIFLLEECLTEEFNSILEFQNFLSLLNRNEFKSFDGLLLSLEKQASVFSQLKNFKSNIKLFEQCSEEVKRLNVEKKNTEKAIIEAVKCQSEQPIIKYVVNSSYLSLNKKIYKTFVETERILINNS